MGRSPHARKSRAPIKCFAENSRIIPIAFSPAGCESAVKSPRRQVDKRHLSLLDTLNDKKIDRHVSRLGR